MITAAIEELPARIHAWLKQVNATEGSPLFEEYKSVEDAEACPSPMAATEADAFFPGLVVVYRKWNFVDEDAWAREGVEGSHLIDLLVFNLSTRTDKPGIVIRQKCARTAGLFLQSPRVRPPVDPVYPEDPTKRLWRPADIAATGADLVQLWAEEVDISDPLEIGKGALFERGRISLRARMESRNV